MNLETRQSEQNGMAKLTYRQAEAIRRKYALGKLTQGALAAFYDVSVPAIWKIVHNQSYTQPPTTGGGRNQNRRKNHR